MVLFSWENQPNGPLSEAHESLLRWQCGWKCNSGELKPHWGESGTGFCVGGRAAGLVGNMCQGGVAVAFALQGPFGRDPAQGQGLGPEVKGIIFMRELSSDEGIQHPQQKWLL